MESLEEKIIAIKTNLYRFAYSLTSNKEDASDLTQETMLKLLSNEVKYKEKNNFKGWAFTIMKNIFINDYRKLSKYQIVDSEYLTLENLNLKNIYEPEQILNAKEIHILINQFPSDLKVPFSLFLSGYSYQEISDRVGIPIGTVKSRIFSVREKLKVVVPRY